MSETNQKSWSTRMAVGRMSYDMGYYSQAIRHFTKALETAKSPGFDQTDLANTYLSLGKSYACTGNVKEAESYLTRALEIDERSPEHIIARATDYVELALFYFKTGRLAEAADYNQKAIDSLDKLENPPVVLLAKALKQLAIVTAEHLNFDLALIHADRAISALENGGGQKQSLIYGEVLMVKTIALVELGKLEEAKDLYARAIQTIELNRGPFHPKVASILDMFSELTAQTGKRVASETLHEEAEEIRKAIVKKNK